MMIEPRMLRDLFAGIALLGLLNNQEDEATGIASHGGLATDYAEASYRIADAMMKLRTNHQELIPCQIWTLMPITSNLPPRWKAVPDGYYNCN